MNFSRTKTLIASAVIALGIAIPSYLVIFQRPVAAFNPQPDPPGFGLVGIVERQTLRINVVNTSVPATAAADASFPPDPCRVVIGFRDGSGNIVTRPNGTPFQRVAQLGAGESTFIALDADNFARTTDGRVTLRPEVRIQQADPINGTPPDPCIPSVEVINSANGRTQFMVPFVPAVQRSAAVSQ